MLASSGLPANRSRSHQDMQMSYSYLTHVKKLEMQPGMRHKVRKSETQKVRKSESQKVSEDQINTNGSINYHGQREQPKCSLKMN